MDDITLQYKYNYIDTIQSICQLLVRYMCKDIQTKQFRVDVFDLFTYPKSFFRQIDSDMFNEQYRILFNNVKTQYNASIDEFAKEHKRLPNMDEFKFQILYLGVLLLSQIRTLVNLHIKYIESGYEPLPKEY